MNGDRVRLAIVVPTMEMGGAERCVSEMLKYLGRERLETELTMVFDRQPFYAIPGDIPVGVLEREPAAMEPVGIELPAELLGLEGEVTWMEMTARKLAERVRRFGATVVLARNLFSSALCCISRKYWPTDVGLIVSCDTYASRALANHPHAALYSYLIEREFGRADAVVALSRGAADDLENSYGVPKGKVRVIHNPVDVDEIRRLCREKVKHRWFSEELPVVTSMGRLVPTKGFESLLRATKVLADKGVRARLVILGDGEDRPRLESIAEELGLSGDLWIAGVEANPFRYIARSSVFALSSLYEGFANVIAEAMACGCPVVSTDCPSGAAEMLEGGKCGLLVPVGDHEALADAILKLIEDQDMRTEMIKRGLERAGDFDSKRIIGLYEELILSVAGKCRG